MTYTLTTQLERLSKLRHEAPGEILVKALERGMAKLYQESVLSMYLKKKIPRRRAIALVGLESVRMADQQSKAVLEDIAWGLKQ